MAISDAFGLDLTLVLNIYYIYCILLASGPRHSL